VEHGRGPAARWARGRPGDPICAADLRADAPLVGPIAFGPAPTPRALAYALAVPPARPMPTLHACKPPRSSPCNAGGGKLLAAAAPVPAAPAAAAAPKAAAKSLIGKDDPTIWHQAAAALPSLDAINATIPKPAADGSSAAAKPQEHEDDLVERLRQQGEALAEAEGVVFERDLERRNPSDAKWLAQVRRGGTTADKVAATTLLVQVGAGGGEDGGRGRCERGWQELRSIVDHGPEGRRGDGARAGGGGVRGALGRGWALHEHWHTNCAYTPVRLAML
jgi:hypothetical protein